MAFIGGKINFMFYFHHLVSVLMFYGVSDEGVLHIFAKKNVEVDFHDLIAIVRNFAGGCLWAVGALLTFLRSIQVSLPPISSSPKSPMHPITEFFSCILRLAPLIRNLTLFILSRSSSFKFSLLIFSKFNLHGFQSTQD